ncbi:hypothetical protein EV651_109155 [Kribbella sp. VKM Ac-2571]|uniref:GNAT family N-acetyltransferase n=1 Tax=Kribbella sp. VKM Ac-2571 TaxID=2512222 RepID=UPI00105CF55E|nr:GNAT family N-acetyltransferase [Kribbella sp. VKM Ac-2571]TDO58880.1 hypothetical protein EV651_109155 [Kribbella sp. VKM Ac-2571]
MDRQLIAPTVQLHERWLKAHAEWGEGLHEDGFGLAASDEVESPEGFAAWIARLTAESDRGTLRWILADGQMLGLARDRGMERVMVVCLAGNAASARTIEHNGGVLAEVRRTGDHPVHQYWIDLGGK